jgi:chromosome segregation ATPase
MQTLNERLEELKATLAGLEQASPRNQSLIDSTTQEIARVTEQINESEAREQKTESYIGEYSDMLVVMFETLWPEQYKSIVGIEAYETMRQDYMRMHTAYNADQLARISADHVAEIGKWREKCDDMNELSTGLQNKVSEQEEVIQEYKDKISDIEEERDKACEFSAMAKSDIRKLEEQLEKAKAAELENVSLRKQIVELEEKLAKSKEPVKNEALDSVINEIKSRKQDDPDAVMQRFLARQVNGPKVMSIDHGAHPELPVLQFRPEVAPTVVEQGADPLPIVDSQFQSPEGNQPIGLPVSEDGSSGGVEESPVTRDEIEARFKRIEDQLGLMAWDLHRDYVA